MLDLKMIVSEQEVEDIAAMSNDARADLVNRINGTDPFTVFDSVEGKEGKEIICPFCGSGSHGIKNTGIKPNFQNGVYRFHCFVCGECEGTLLNIIAKINNLSTRGKDFFKVLAISKKSLNLNTCSPDDKTQFRKSARKSEKEKSFVNLSQARADLNKIGTFRGLSIETLRRLKCGYSEKVYFQDIDKELPAVIIPNDKGGVFARSVEGKHYRNNRPTDTTTIYLPDSDSSNVAINVLIVEGAINGASILQAIPNPTFGIIASGGTSGVNHVVEKIKSLRDEGKKIHVIIAFDNDTNKAGQNAAEKLFKRLIQALIPAYIVDITKTPDIDLNDVLQSEGADKLAELINSALAQIVFEEIISENATDFPINLKMPGSFRISSEKLLYKEKVISYTAPLITKKYQQDDKVFYEVTFFVDNQRKNIIVSAISLLDKSKLTALSEFGLDANSLNAKILCSYFSKLIGINSKEIPIERLYTQGGWTDDSCTSFIYPNNQKVSGNNFDYARAFKSSGDKEKFKSLLFEALMESFTAGLVVGVALAAPLIKPLSISNKQLHLGCRSGNGKTAIVKLSVAIFGDPKFLMVKFNSTANAIENISVALNDFPSAIDELQSINKFQRESIDDLLYNFENGRIRNRLTRQGNFQRFKYFRGCRITTGEQPLTTEYSNEGAKKRCVEISENKILREELAIEIHRLVDSNYGLYGRDWVEYIRNHIKEIIDDYNSIFDALFKENRSAFAEHISLVAVAQVALKHFCILIFNDLENQKITEIFDVKKILEQLPIRQEMQNGKRAIAAVAELYSSHSNYFPKIEENGSITTSERAPYEIYGYVLKNGDILIFPKVLREYLKEFPNFQAIVRDFSELGYLEEINDKKHPHQKSIKLDSKTIWGYIFKRSELFNISSTCKRKSQEENFEVANDEVFSNDDGYSFEED